MSEQSTVWISQGDAEDLGLKGHEFPCRVMELGGMVYEVLKCGAARDIVVLPYSPDFGETVNHIRNRGIVGPIIVYSGVVTDGAAPSEQGDQGVIFLDSSKIVKPVILELIASLRKYQDMAHVSAAPRDMRSGPPASPSLDPDEIRELFRSILKDRGRILLHCRFKDGLPSLTVACEIIQMMGDPEIRLILDNFRPEEFVELYAELGTGSILTGFYTSGEKTIGFDLKVESCLMGKLTVLLPEGVYDQKREFYRVEPDQGDPLVINILPRDHHTLQIPVHDVSEGGVGLFTTYARLEEREVYPIALVLPMENLSSYPRLEKSHFFPVDLVPPLPPTLLGSAEIVSKEEEEDGTFYYGLSLELHSADVQHLQHYIFKRQLDILSTIRSKKTASQP